MSDRFGLVGPSYTNQALSADAQQTINWYVEVDESGAGNAPVILLPTPGLKPFVNLGVQLAISKMHSGNFTQGQNGATYTVTVSNPGAVPTNGVVTVTETAPSGLTFVSMSGSGWTVVGNVATRSDVLNSGASYPPLTVTVNVASDATSPQVNQSSVSGGGTPQPVYANDPTIILSSQVLAMACFPQSLGSNLILNPGFETGDFTSWTPSTHAIVTAAQSHTGTYSANSNLSTSNASQNPSTTRFNLYRLRFWAKCVGGGFLPEFSWGGVPYYGELQTPTANFGWSQFIADVQAGVPGSSVLSQMFFDTHAFIDDIGVQQITAGYITTGSSVSWSYNPTASVEFWFKTSSTDGGVFVANCPNQTFPDSGAPGIHAPPSWNFIVGMDPFGKIGAGFFTGAFGGAGGLEPVNVFSSGTASSYNDGNLHQCVVTLSAGTIKIYIDGALQVTSTVTPGSGSTTGYWRMLVGPVTNDSFTAAGTPCGTGWSFYGTSIDSFEAGGTSFVNSCLSHFSIFSGVLTGAQVLANYNAMKVSQSNYESVVSAESPTNFWYLNEASGTVATDHAGSLNGTYHGTFNLNQTTPVPS